MNARRVCLCGADLDEAGACPTCGTTRAWSVVVEGVTVAVASRAEVLLGEELEGRLRRALAEAPPEVPGYAVRLPGRRR